MPRMLYDYTKSTLEKVSVDPKRFKKELLKALRQLLPYEVEQLLNWLRYYTTNKPELLYCVMEISL